MSVLPVRCLPRRLAEESRLSRVAMIRLLSDRTSRQHLFSNIAWTARPLQLSRRTTPAATRPASAVALNKYLPRHREREAHHHGSNVVHTTGDTICLPAGSLCSLQLARDPTVPRSDTKKATNGTEGEVAHPADPDDTASDRTSHSAGRTGGSLKVTGLATDSQR